MLYIWSPLIQYFIKLDLKIGDTALLKAVKLACNGGLFAWGLDYFQISQFV